ncbi:hypothetical protein MFLAVUS_006462 [Mucor flavus]|uniref:Cas12f1-like TNB domain-containing protein n=1 Tax=Mucor flavus TaxID=439312 RepID=A0ABP9Z1L2_9FUNG
MKNSLLKIKALSSFLRDVTFKAQVFVNYYILKHSKDLSNDIFKQNFWYSVCRVVYKKLSVEDFQKQYSKMPSLADTWNELNNREGVNLTVAIDGISNYGQVISTACETISTSNAFPAAKVSAVKYLVYQFIFDGVFSSQPTTVEVPDDTVPPTEQDDKHKIQGLIANSTLEIRNRLPSFPVTKETLNKAPFDIMLALRHMLSKYEDLIAKNPNPQTQESEQKPHEKSNTKTKKQKGKNPEAKKQTEKKFIPPRVFSLFPSPGLRWRFIKIDSQNLKSIFPDVAPKQNHNETLYEYTLRCFYECFNFGKLKIKRFTTKKFLNGLYTDGYTCRVLFCRKLLPSLAEHRVSLELDDFTTEEVEQYFRPCAVDLGRIDAFVSYHGGNDIRRLSSSEYYNMHGTVTRQKSEQDRKGRSGLEAIETNIPSPKTLSIEKYSSYITYMIEHLNALHSFYNFETAKIKWLNYLASQKTIQESVNILLNGGKKYNKQKRKQTKWNRKKRKKAQRSHANFQEKDAASNSVHRKKSSNRKNKNCFKEGDVKKMPLVVFGDGLKNKDHIKLKGHRHGLSNKIYKQLKLREGLGELLLLNINEYYTSKTCNSCLNQGLKNLEVGKGEDVKKLHQVLVCTTCNIFWNRDVMASKNMMSIATSIWSGNGHPNVFKRKNATSNVVVAPHLEGVST